MEDKNIKEFIKIWGRFAIIILLLFKVMYPFELCYRYNKKDIIEVQKIVQKIKDPSTALNPKLDSINSININVNVNNKNAVAIAKRKRQKRCLHEIIVKIASRYNVDPALIKAIIRVESSFNPKAVSYKGAKGLMQLMPVTLKAMGVRDPFDPEFNIEAGVRYFKKLLIMFDNNVELALAAYNAGVTRVRIYKGIPPFRRTRRYVKKVLYYYRYYKREMLEASSGDHDV